VPHTHAQALSMQAFLHPPSMHCSTFLLFPPSPAVQQHYCVTVGIKDSSGLLQGFSLPQYQQQAILPQPLRGAGGNGGRGMGRGMPPPPPPRFMM